MGDETGVSQSEARIEPSVIPEGSFGFSSQKENGMARVENRGGELAVVMLAPMEGFFKDGKKTTTVTPDGKEKEVLEISLLALSPKNTEGAVLKHLQLDRESLLDLFAVAAEQGIIPRSESKWAPGGKMEQLTKFALDLDARLGK